MCIRDRYPSHLKDEFILLNLNLFIELYFYKNINAQKKNIFKAKEYFLKKLSSVKNCMGLWQMAANFVANYVAKVEKKIDFKNYKCL